MKPDTVRGHLDLILLATLARAPRHGYAVITALRERSDGALDLVEGSVYPALHRLESRGLLTSEWQVEAGRRRRIYAVTEAGQAELRGEQQEWHSLVRAIAKIVPNTPNTAWGIA